MSKDLEELKYMSSVVRGMADALDKMVVIQERVDSGEEVPESEINEATGAFMIKAMELAALNK